MAIAKINLILTFDFNPGVVLLQKLKVINKLKGASYPKNFCFTVFIIKHSYSKVVHLS